MSEADIQQQADELHYRGAMRRIYFHTAWVSVAGTAVAVWLADWAFGLGFALGALASALNFRWLHRLVDSLAPGTRKPGRGLGIWLSLRYVLFGAVGYILVRYYSISIMGVLVGLFVAVAGVLLEILYELIYARA